DLEGLEVFLEKTFGMKKGILSELDIESLTKDKLLQFILTKANEIYDNKEKEFGEETFREIERIVLLQVVDSKWMDHIDAMDQLKQGIGLRAMGQEDPARAYQIEGFDMFEEMTISIWEDTVQFLFHAVKSKPVERKRVANPIEIGSPENTNRTVVNKTKKVGRNDPCPCGSGKKYKK
ncbi:SEC-C metal-binding domain-containing protein, partial [Vibrio parahaemolyticus]|nr:SEC-C metal-binding domain-containing protein [Vibrio parahaemolyticus]